MKFDASIITKQFAKAGKCRVNSYVSEERTVEINANRYCLWFSLLIVLLTFVAYQPALFNFAIGDDFNMFWWLKTARNDVSLIWQQFYRPWAMNLSHYRPLTMVCWATEYAAWGTNELCFRATSIVSMLLTSLLLALTTFEMSKLLNHQNHKQYKIGLVWAISSAALFAFYPLHCEPVNWVCSQHDVLVTLFSLLSIWCYIRWRRSSSSNDFAISLGSMSAAVLCKEMAVTLPFVLYSYEALCLEKTIATKRTGVFDTSPTLPYWFILAIYLGVRKFVLGTFTGNLPVDFYNGMADMLRAWLHGLRQIVLPINTTVIPQGSPIAMLWMLAVVLSLASSFYAFRFSDNKKPGLFLLAWFALSLIPAYKLFIISPDLTGSRVAYMATAPLCVFLTYGIANFSISAKHSLFVRTIGCAVNVLAILILYCNNLAYAAAGDLSNRVVHELRKYYRAVPDDPQVRLLGLPRAVAGAIGGMTKTPFLERDIHNCDVLNHADQFYPFGFLKESIATNESQTTFLYWDWKTTTLKKVIRYTIIPKPLKQLEGNRLRLSIKIESNRFTKSLWEADNIFHIISTKPSCMEVNLKDLPCWPADFICFTVEIAPLAGNNAPRQFDLHFMNDIVPDCSWKDYSSWLAFSRIQVIPNGREQHLLFPLRGFPDWAMGGKCHGLRLVLPPYSDMRLKAISLPETNTVIPMVTGQIVICLNKWCDHHKITYDANGIKGCQKVVLEVIGPNKDFETLYSSTPNKDILLEIRANKPAGAIEIWQKSFPSNGYYKARLRALNKDGKQIGLCGDHFLIGINP